MQKNAVVVEGEQAVIIVVMKSSEASTLEVVEGIKEMIPRIEQIVPEGVKVKLLIDASGFVKESITDVVHEMVIAGALVGFIVLLLLGSWRATVIVSTSIPLSILSSLIGLHALGESINVMTLGGLALAVGILVDDAAVMIENIDRISKWVRRWRKRSSTLPIRSFFQRSSPRSPSRSSGSRCSI